MVTDVNVMASGAQRRSISHAIEGHEVSEQGQVEVVIRYRDVEKTIRGKPEEVFRGVFQFLSETIPALDVVSRITLTVNFADFLREAAGVFAVTPEGVVVLTPLEALTDRELVMLYLIRAKVAFETGKVRKGNSPRIGSHLVDKQRIWHSGRQTERTVRRRTCRKNWKRRVPRHNFRTTSFPTGHASKTEGLIITERREDSHSRATTRRNEAHREGNSRRGTT